MPSNKMRAFIAKNPHLSAEQIEAERQKRIHHIASTQADYDKLHHYDTEYSNQAALF